MSTVIKIIPDLDAFDPRMEWDNQTTLALFHRRYRLGDKSHGISSGDFTGWDGMLAFIEKKFKPVYVTGVWMYDHGGITIKSSPFGDPWDSGQIGFAWITREQLAECAGPFKRLTAKLRERARRIVESDIEVYDQYLRGDVYGFVVEVDGKETDSCWGFYGSDPAKNGMWDHIGNLIEEGAEVVHV